MIKDQAERLKFQKLTRAFYGITALTAGLSFWLGGVDFGKGALIGCAIVAINFFITQRLTAKLVYDKGSKGLAIGAYFFKIALTVLVLFIAITKFNINMMGIIAGLSTIVVASLISSLSVSNQNTTDENNNL